LPPTVAVTTIGSRTGPLVSVALRVVPLVLRPATLSFTDVGRGGVMNSSQMANFIAVAALLINVAALTALVVQIKRAKDAFVAEQDLARKGATMDYIVATTELREQLGEQVPAERDLVKVAQFLHDVEKDEATKSRLQRFMNYWENLAAGTNIGIYDFDIVNRTVGGTVITLWNVYGDYARRERTTRNRPEIYVEIEMLSEKLLSVRGRGRSS
jgi:hypothetical protein